MNNEAHFHSTAFNCTEPRDYFINECCFGDDLCRWLIQQLHAQGIQTAADPSQEDFGWYFTFTEGGTEHCFIVSFQSNDPTSGDQWIAWVERQPGFIGSLFGGRQRGIRPEAIHAISAALTSSPDIRNLSWHEH